MKKIEDTPLLRNRRLVLSAVIASPLLLCSLFSRAENRIPAAPTEDSGEFVIVNGWVLLKRDIA